MHENQRPMTSDEAAAFTGLKKNYLYKLICQGKIPCYKPNGGRGYFKPSELESFLFRNRKAADYEAVGHA